MTFQSKILNVLAFELLIKNVLLYNAQMPCSSTGLPGVVGTTRYPWEWTTLHLPGQQNSWPCFLWHGDGRGRVDGMVSQDIQVSQDDRCYGIIAWCKRTMHVYTVHGHIVSCYGISTRCNGIFTRFQDTYTCILFVCRYEIRGKYFKFSIN